MITFNSNILAAIDVETTGTIPGYHEIIQVAIVPLDQNLDPMDVSPFNMLMRPDYPERIDPIALKVSGITREMLDSSPDKHQVAETLHEWFGYLDLPRDKRMIHLTQNGQFDIPFMKFWLGETGFKRYFTFNGRDTMQLALGMNDQCAYKCQPVPFPQVGLKPMCRKFGIALDNHHDALSDCLATAKVYRELLRYEL